MKYRPPCFVCSQYCSEERVKSYAISLLIEISAYLNLVEKRFPSFTVYFPRSLTTDVLVVSPVVSARGPSSPMMEYIPYVSCWAQKRMAPRGLG